MQLKTLLNAVHPVKGFVYGKVQRIEDDSVANGFRLQVQGACPPGLSGHLFGLRENRAGVRSAP
jgi:hypothetical protein